MEEEREMCQNCKRDIPVSNYHVHSIHCKRNFVVCTDCGETMEKGDLEEHERNAHSIMICDQCGIRVEAIKFSDHRNSLCSKLLLICRYCEADVPASELSEHEGFCGDREEKCPQCGEWLCVRDWPHHLSTRHGMVVQRSPNRQRREGSVRPTSQMQAPELAQAPKTEALAMLPCEFCEGLVPIHKLLEHQAECVNPSNVRGSSVLRTSASASTFQSSATSALDTSTPLGPFSGGSGVSRSHSLHNPHQKPQHQSRGRSTVTQRRMSNTLAVPNSETLAREREAQAKRRHSRYQSLLMQDDEPCEVRCDICDEMIPTERIDRHQMTCVKRPESSYAIRAASITRTTSVREARATTEERSMRGLYRQSSFTERSYARRTESLSRQSSFSRSSRYSSNYGYDYASASRRSTVYNGYSGFAMYSSINQGLDDISYGGRISRRNSITESSSTFSRRGSVVTTGAAQSQDFSLPTLMATYEATRNANGAAADKAKQPAVEHEQKKAIVNGASSSLASATSVSRQNSLRHEPESTGRSTSISRQSSCRKQAREGTSTGTKSKSGSKLSRTVSFTDKDPVIIPREGDDEPSKPTRRKKEKDPKKKKVKKREKSVDPNALTTDEKRKSQPLGDELFEKVSSKLKEVEREQRKQEEQEEQMQQEKLAKISLVTPHVRPDVTNVVSDPNLSKTSFASSAKQSGVKSSGRFYGLESGYSTSASNSTGEADISRKTNNADETDDDLGISFCPPPKPVASFEVAGCGPLAGLSTSSSVDQDMAFGACSSGYSGASSKVATSSEASPQQKPKQNRNSGVFSSSAFSVDSSTESVRKREKRGSITGLSGAASGSAADSKTSSKRNSLDGKSVQTLAQDLAAECAKAYALMENSLSKLSTEFGVGPFGITSRSKRSRRTQPPEPSE